MKNEETISMPMLRKMERSLGCPLRIWFLVFYRPDVEADIMDLPGFVGVEDYPSSYVKHPLETGAVDKYCFIPARALKQAVVVIPWEM